MNTRKNICHSIDECKKRTGLFNLLKDVDLKIIWAVTWSRTIIYILIDF